MSNNFFPNITSTVQSITTSIALVTPQTNIGYQPLSAGTIPNANAANPPTLLFHTEGENTAHIQSDITDHFIEDNSAINDQISLKPEVVTVHGFIGELNDVFPVANIPNNGQISAVLPNIASFVPTLTTAGQAAINEAAAGYATAAAANNAVVAAQGAFTGGGTNNVVGSSGLSPTGSPQNLQQAMFQQFYLYWRTRTLFSVQTPWAVFTNMAIMELRASQDETTRVITDFYVSFKMLRFSTTFLETPDEFNGVGRAGVTVTNLGQSAPVPVTSVPASSYTGINWASAS